MDYANGEVSLQTRWTLIVIIVPHHTKNRTGKHTVHIYSDGIELQQAQKPQQMYQEKVCHLYTPANTARNRRELTTSTHMLVLHVTPHTLTSGHTHTTSHKMILIYPHRVEQIYRGIQIHISPIPDTARIVQNKKSHSRL